VKTSFKVTGLAELGRRMRALGGDIEGKIAFGAVLAGANLIKKEAIALAPVGHVQHEIDDVEIQPGNLKKNIVTKRVPKGQREMTAEYVVTVRGKAKAGFASRYGAIQEFGSVKQSPQPYMRPAYEHEKGFALAKIVEVLKKRIDKAEAGQ
jgi:HK97 gp10 family phage protein